MKLSVVTISYNQADYLERCLNSVLSQKDGIDLEYIVIDACSTDGSAKILECYRNQLTKLVIEKDLGAADGLNKGFSYASGDIYYYLNSDDYVLPNAFQRALRYFEEYPDTDVIYGNGIIVDGNDKKLRSTISDQNLNIYHYNIGAITVMQQSKFFRSEIFHKVNGFNIDNHTCWDGELIVAMKKAGANFMYMNESLGAFRLHDAGISGSGKLFKQYKNDKVRIFREYYNREMNWADVLMKHILRIKKKAKSFLLSKRLN